MRSKIIQLALAVVVITSMTIAGCSGNCGIAEFELSSLIIAPSAPYINQDIIISVDITNTGEERGNYSAILTVNSNAIESKEISMEPDEKQTVIFTYTPVTAGSYYINVGELNGALQVQDEPAGYWSTNYKVAGGKIVLLFSLFGATPELREVSFSAEQIGTFTLLVNMSSTNGKRNVIVPKDAWYFEPIFVENCVTGVNMTVDMSLSGNGSGWLYTQDGIGDVDVSSESALGKEPIQVNTIGDGTIDSAGSMLLNMPLHGFAATTAGQSVNLPLDLIFTTGHIYNIVSRPDKGINGSEMESTGIPFAEDGGPSPYVGTAGTITTTGTGASLNLRLAGFETDFQAEIQLELVPE
ncbi:MAG: CARDB domain-containing protein [Dehalococcoidia bacterium]|jgi:hypothetical protein